VVRQTQRPLPDNTQPSQETGIHAPSWIRTSNPSSRADADQRLRQRGHLDRRCSYSLETECNNVSADCINPFVVLSLENFSQKPSFRLHTT